MYLGKNTHQKPFFFSLSLQGCGKDGLGLIFFFLKLEPLFSEPGGSTDPSPTALLSSSTKSLSFLTQNNDFQPFSSHGIHKFITQITQIFANLTEKNRYDF